MCLYIILTCGCKWGLCQCKPQGVGGSNMNTLSLVQNQASMRLSAVQPVSALFAARRDIFMLISLKLTMDLSTFEVGLVYYTISG